MRCAVPPYALLSPGAPRALSAAWCYLRHATCFDAFQRRVAFLPRRICEFGKGR
jgi:hypothetical protein